jgi:hypothetical protein
MLKNGQIQRYIKALIPEVADLKGTRVFPANIAAASPEKPYIIYRVISQTETGQAQRTNVATVSDLTETVTQRKEAQIEINFYSKPLDQDNLEDSRYWCNLFLERIRLSSSEEKSVTEGFYVMSWNDYSNLDQYLGDKWESRASCELAISFNTSQDDSIQWIETIEVNGNIINHNGDPI